MSETTKTDKKERYIHPLTDARIEQYCQRMHSNDNPALEELNRQTHLKFVKPNMVTGAWQGEFLMMLCRLFKPKRILEIGTFSGYATTCFALATDDDCKIDTVEAMQEYEPFLRENFIKNNVMHKIKIHFGQGLEVIKTLQDKKYDLIFLDAEKVHYPLYYPLLVDMLKQGGLLLADNILWYGKVVLDNVNDKETAAIRQFNEMATKDLRVENIIIPIRDGIMAVRRI